MRTLVLAALATSTLATATLTGTAIADDRLNVTPTLYRDLARATAAVRPASELTTTPSLTPRAPATRRLVADADGAPAR